MRHGKILFLHPVLRPGGFDYNKDCHFAMTITESKRSAEGVVGISATLDLASITLNQLIEKRKAQFLVMMQCAKTYYRSVGIFDGPQIILEIPSDSLAGTLHLTPYVVSSHDLDWIVSDEHEDEIRGIQGGDRIPKGSVLAVGASHVVEMDEIGTIQSAIKIQSNEQVKEGQYAINTVEDFVVIELGPRTYTNVARIRARLRELLYPSIYQAAIEHAMRKMGEEPDRKWAKALRKTLEDYKLGEDDVSNNPNHCAQVILDDPLGRMIDRCNRGIYDGC